MGIKTTATFQNDEYGIFEFKNNKFVFRPLGKLPVLGEVLECVEDDRVYFMLSTPFYGRQKIAYISQGDLSDPQLIKDLANLGFDVTKALSNYFIDVIRLPQPLPTAPLAGSNFLSLILILAIPLSNCAIAVLSY